MAHYRLLWLEIAEQQYLDLDDPTRDLADRQLTMLQLDPHSLPGAVYDTAPDQWTISLGDRGLLLYAVPDRHYVHSPTRFRSTTPPPSRAPPTSAAGCSSA